MHKKRFFVFLLASMLVFSSIPLAYAEEGNPEVLSQDEQATRSNAEALDQSPQNTSEEAKAEEGIDQDVPLQAQEAEAASDTVIPEVSSDRVGEEDSYIPGEIIVSFSDGYDIDGKIETLKQELCGYAEVAIEQEAEEQGIAPLALAEEATTTEELEEEIIDTEVFSNPIATVAIPEELTMEQAIAIAEATPGVVAVQANYTFEPQSDETKSLWIPNDPFVGNGTISDITPTQWWLYRTKTIQAWNNPKFPAKPNMSDKSTVTVAVLDTGCDLYNPDLRPNLDVQNAWDAHYDCKLGDSPSFSGTNYYDVQVHGHGTDVSATIAAVTDNGIGNAGMGNNRIKVLPVNVFYVDPNNKLITGDTNDIIKGIKKVIEYKKQGMNIRVINMSLGGYLTGLDHAGAVKKMASLYGAINDARTLGILPVAAGGNDDTTEFHFPADFDNVIGVTATKNDDGKWGSSNQYKDICAPGEVVKASSTNNNRRTGGKSSNASPKVAATAALLFAADPSLTPLQVEKTLYDTAEDIGAPGRDDYFGHGMLNVAAALEAVTGTEESIDISRTSVSGISAQTYSGTAFTPNPIITHEGKTLVKDTDYTLSYENNTNAGVATVTITGKGGFTGSTTTTFEICRLHLIKTSITSIPDQVYTGKGLTPHPVITFNGRTLVKDIDYTLIYRNNTNVGTASIYIAGIGNFQGTNSRTFNIVAGEAKTQISAASVTSTPNQTYSGSAFTPNPIITHGGKTLVKDKDYSLTYKNNTNAGTATITITGIGGYTGSRAETFTIDKASIHWVNCPKIPDQIYTGKAITPAHTLSYQGKNLIKDVDYTVSYTNNIEVGTGKINYYGKGNFKENTGLGMPFKIVQAPGSKTDISAASVASTPAQTYTGSAFTPNPIITHGGKTLVKDKDYSLTYKNNTNAGTATITITGIGSYTGSRAETFTINKRHVMFFKGKDVPDQIYTGSALTPILSFTYNGNTLVKDVDFTLRYADNVNVGIHAKVYTTGIGNYEGTMMQYFDIVDPSKTDIFNATVQPISTQIYSGNAFTPNPIITHGGKTLVKNKDYTLTYKNNTNAGTATITITGIGSYTGSRGETFTIDKAKLKASGIKAPSSYAYTGKPVTPEPIVTFNGMTLVKDVDYTFDYWDNTEKGRAGISTAGKGNFTGILYGAFWIR